MRVENDLKPHNVETIKRILEFYKTSNKCCAIQATGTGKTFLILRLLEIYNDMDKCAVIFAPNREIINQTKKRMKKFGLNNATFYTYQKLARMIDEEIRNINADLIVCDELHRTGAKTWGQKFEVLVETHSDSKVFGVTATPLRCADGRDMADEYFDGNKACDISLAEALVRKIIPVMPVYVSALYTFEEEYKNMSVKIENGRNTNEEKTELMKEIKAAKQQLEKSNGIPEIIKKYITNYNGKYIVFCKDKKHLYAMKDVVIEWFRDAGYNGKIFDYPYYSNNNEVKRNLTNFENNEEDGLKLLFVIDKLNEGLHLDVIHGCILLRTTTSNIIYYQQIGRAIDAGCDQKRVILDLVSNFNSLKTFNLKDELNEKIIERQNGKFSECSEEFDIEEFHVNDYVQECIEVFNNIDTQIKSSWWGKYELYKKYMNGDESIDYRKNLKCWVVKNKRDYFDKKLTLDKITALNNIGFDFSKKYKSFQWDKYFNILKEYSLNNNVNDIPRNTIINNVNIGNWVHLQRVKKGNGKLHKEKIDKLESIGFVWDIPNNQFYVRLNELKLYIKNNNCYPPRSEKQLSNFVSSIRKSYKKNLLDEQKMKELLKMNFCFDSLEERWTYKYNLCIEYIEKYNIFPISTTMYKNCNIGYWIGTQKKQLMDGKVPQKRITLLKKLGVDVDKYMVA